MVVTDDEEVYRRCFAFHDQGHSPLRTGVEIGKRPFVGLDFRFTELQAAVLIAAVPQSCRASSAICGPTSDDTRR